MFKYNWKKVSTEIRRKLTKIQIVRKKKTIPCIVFTFEAAGIEGLDQISKLWPLIYIISRKLIGIALKERVRELKVIGIPLEHKQFTDGKKFAELKMVYNNKISFLLSSILGDRFYMD